MVIELLQEITLQILAEVVAEQAIELDPETETLLPQVPLKEIPVDLQQEVQLQAHLTMEKVAVEWDQPVAQEMVVQEVMVVTAVLRTLQEVV